MSTSNDSSIQFRRPLVLNHPFMAWQAPVFTSELNWFGIPPCLILRGEHREDDVEHDKYRKPVLRLVLAAVRCASAWTWLLLAKYTALSLVLFAVAVLAHAVDFAIVFKYTTIECGTDKLAFVASHASVVNFVLDIPGWAAGKRLWWHHALIVIANTVGVVAVVFGSVWSYDYAMAWQCYGGVPLDELVDGYCITWPGGHMPRGICSAGDRTGPKSSCDDTSVDVLTAIAHPIFVFAIALAFSFAVYVGVIPAKLKEAGRKQKGGRKREPANT